MPAAPLPPDAFVHPNFSRSDPVADAPPETAFDSLTRQAQEICGAPTATLSLVDNRRRWFKRKANTPSADLFRAHTLVAPRRFLLVPDAAADPRYVDSPAVTGPTKVRFYAGVPLFSPEGRLLGTLCVYDRTPHELSAEQIGRLSDLAPQAVHLLALRRRVPTERRLALGFAVTLALLLSILGLCSWQAERFLESDGWVEHAKEVAREISETLAEVQWAESSQNGFSATGQDDFLDAFEHALASIPGRLEAIRTLASDNPEQVARCDQLAALIDRRVEVMRERIAERRQLGAEALDPVHLDGRERHVMQQLRAKGREMLNAESVLYHQRETMRDRDLRAATGTLLGTGALCVSLLTAGFLLSRRELRRREALGSSLSRANASLRTEVTERRRAQESLRESEARFRRIANNVPGMVYRFVLHADGTYALPFVSEGARKIYGLAPEQIQRDVRLIMDCVHPDDREEYIRSIADSAATLAPRSWQGRIHQPGDGQVRWVQGAAQPERQPDGSVVWDGVLVDATARHLADEHRHAKEEAERNNREKSRFLSRVSHELRTPLNAILGFSQLLQLSSLRGQDAEALGYILRSGQHLLGLVDEVLDLSRAESGELQLVPVRVDAAALVRECLQLTVHLAGERRITSRVEEDAPAVLWCDEQRLRQILLNLLSNATKYNREGGEVCVRLQVLAGRRWRLEVVDTGEGIVAEDLARLFVPFTRLQTDTRTVEGTGLGLVVSRRVAEAMGGRLGLESIVGTGTTAWVELPLGEDPGSESPPAPFDADALRSLLASLDADDRRTHDAPVVGQDARATNEEVSPAPHPLSAQIGTQ